MDDIGLKRLAELIHHETGIDYRKQLLILEGKIKEQVSKLGLSYWEYAGYVLMERMEWERLIESVTVNETYFFREEYLLREFERVVDSEYRWATPDNPLIIWCAACSTGEEPYTLSMIIQKLGGFAKGSVKIFASDINLKVLEKARLGLYHKSSFSFRRMPTGATESYFDLSGEFYEIKPAIKERVSFQYNNLLGSTYSRELLSPDIIFCRNVLIYFDHEKIQEVIDRFYEFSKPKAYLFLGHSEALTHYKHYFETIYTENTFYYRKGGRK